MFRRITVPSILPTIVVVTTYMVINALKVFDIVFVMGNAESNGTEVIAERMIRWFFIRSHDGRGRRHRRRAVPRRRPGDGLERPPVPRAGDDPVTLTARSRPTEEAATDRRPPRASRSGARRGGWFVRITILVGRRRSG